MLVVATPQVLAQAATARQFDVKDEIETKENLDNQPDEDRSPVTASLQIYLEDVEYFLASLGRLKNKGEFDSKIDTFYVAQNSMIPCVGTNIAGSYSPIRFDSTSKPSRVPIEKFTEGMIYGYSLGDCLNTEQFNGTSAVASHFNFQLNQNAFSVDVTIKKQSEKRASELQRELENTLSLYAVHAAKVRQIIIEHTAFRTDNDQVLITTNFPRSDLDSLFSIAVN